jgi:hypothetical protein
VFDLLFPELPLALMPEALALAVVLSRMGNLVADNSRDFKDG